MATAWQLSPIPTKEISASATANWTSQPYLFLTLGLMSEEPFTHLFLTQNVAIFSHRAVIQLPLTTLYNSSEHKSRLILVPTALLLSYPLRPVSCAPFPFVSWMSLSPPSNVVTTHSRPTRRSRTSTRLSICLSSTTILAFCSRFLLSLSLGGSF